MDSKVEYRFRTSIWRHKGGWHFATLPLEMTAEIRSSFGALEEGWGRLKAVATVAGVEWSTAIWFDTKSARYLLPVKKTIRQQFQNLDGELDFSKNLKMHCISLVNYTVK